ncbi:MAG TPA: glycosyltransferase family 2 protein [Candidatus Saccharimonadales bacterium]|nr:glycosyltransferase family 2 protein [Candidatus Saccharimonadales bacterium]
MTVPVVAGLIFALSVLLDLAVPTLTYCWGHRRQLSSIAAASTAFSMTALLWWRPGFFGSLFLTVGAYRVFNLLRIAEGRMHETYLRRAIRRSSFMLNAAQLFVVLLWIDWHYLHIASNATWLFAVTLQLSVAALFLASTLRRAKRTAWPPREKQVPDKLLPAVTVAIPARNETDDLQTCLDSLIKSDYPKLEILVFDDCSPNRRTPDIIRSFAHAGVRFISGEEPEPTWLAKNNAYARLAAEASGEYLLFCGADVRFSSDSIRQIMEFMLNNNKQMISILPLRHRTTYSQFSLIQAMRYWWELVPPRRFFNRPPVISSCWVIQVDILQKAGGFAAVSRSIVPEAYFAKQLLATDGYSFRRSSKTLGIESAKSVSEQRATAVRTRYPQLHRRPENVLLSSVLELSFLVLPFGLFLGAWWIHPGMLYVVIEGVTCLLLVVSYLCMVLETHINSWWFAPIGLPLMVLMDIGLMHYSMGGYEFSTVSWKGRNICIPAMHVVAHLPPVKT